MRHMYNESMKTFYGFALINGSHSRGGRVCPRALAEGVLSAVRRFSVSRSQAYMRVPMLHIYKDEKNKIKSCRSTETETETETETTGE